MPIVIENILNGLVILPTHFYFVLSFFISQIKPLNSFQFIIQKIVNQITETIHMKKKLFNLVSHSKIGVTK